MSNMQLQYQVRNALKSKMEKNCIFNDSTRSSCKPLNSSENNFKAAADQIRLRYYSIRVFGGHILAILASCYKMCYVRLYCVALVFECFWLAQCRLAHLSCRVSGIYTYWCVYVLDTSKGSLRECLSFAMCIQCLCICNYNSKTTKLVFLCRCRVDIHKCTPNDRGAEQK